MPSPLSVEDAVKIGLARNPQALAAKKGAESALATYQSLSVPPPLTLGATQVQGTSSAPTLTGQTSDTFLDLSETIDTSGQRRYQAAAANAQFRAADFTYRETLLSLEQQIRDGYWSLVAARAQEEIAGAGLKDAQTVYDLTVKQNEAGTSPRGDVVRSSIDVANAKQSLLTAQSATHTALVTFNTLLARGPEQDLNLASSMSEESEAPPPVQVPTIDALNAEAKANRPLLKSQFEQTRAANYAVRQAEAARFPDLSVQYQRSLHEPIETWLFGLSFPLFDFGSVSGTVRSARKSREQAEATSDQTIRQVEQQVSQAHTDLETALKAAQSYKKEILDPSVTLLGMAQLGYKQGATGILPVIDAESTLRNARVGYVNSLLAIHKAQDEVLAAVGVLPKVGGHSA